jgi:hypothetical protein
MTSTIDRQDAGTQEITYTLSEPAHTLVRPYVTGENPIYRPGGPVTTDERTFQLADGETLYRPVGADELARFAAGATLVLPTDAEPHEPRHAAPTFYGEPEGERPRRYRGERRLPEPDRRRHLLHLLVAFGLGAMAHAVLVLTGALVLVVVR